MFRRYETLPTALSLVVCVGIALSVVPRPAVGQTVCNRPAGADLITGDIAGISNYATFAGMDAFAFGTTACNVSTVDINWIAATNQHPVVGQNMFRLRNGMFEQIGQSWLHHEFVALANAHCCACNGHGNTVLGAGCSSPNSSGSNGTQAQCGPKFEVNPHTGVFAYPFTEGNQGPSGNSIYKRLQVAVSDLDPSLDGGGLYFVEAQYVCPDDSLAAHQNDNASYRSVSISGSGQNWNAALQSTTQRERCGLRAWRDQDSGVAERDVQVAGDGLLVVSAKATDLGGGLFHYEYAVQNLNVDRAVRSFRIPLRSGASVSNVGFHDVAYHSGEPFDGADWPATVTTDSITWSTSSFSANPNANALRWGTLYNFRFDATAMPVSVMASLELFKPGTPASVMAAVPGPVGGLTDCNTNGIPDSSEFGRMKGDFGSIDQNTGDFCPMPDGVVEFDDYVALDSYLRGDAMYGPFCAPVPNLYDMVRYTGDFGSADPVTRRFVPIPDCIADQLDLCYMEDYLNGGNGTECTVPLPIQEPPGKHMPPGRPVSDCASCESGCDAGFGDPVYPFSGEFYDSATDIEITGRGFDFKWSRKYRSKAEVSSAQGVGCDFAYNISILAEGQNLVVCDGNTRRDTYTLQANGTWRMPGQFQEISQQPGGAFRLTFADMGRWEFGPLNGAPAAGKILASIDRNGNTMRFEYDGGGRLSVIRDTLDTPANPRVINIGYTAEGRVATVTDFAGRQVRYEYYGANDPDGALGDLKSVTSPAVTGTPNGNDFPNGKTTVFTYTRGFSDERLNHNLLTIRDAMGQVYLRNDYAHTISPSDPRHATDPTNINFDRVVRQLWGNQGPGPSADTIDFFYVAQTPSASNNFAVIKVIVNDRVGNVKEFFYDDANHLVIARDYTGRANADAVTTETQNRPTGKLRSEDPDFFETRHEFNADSRRTRIVHPNLNEELFVYDSGNPDPRARGNLLQHCWLPGSLGGDQAQICETFEYDTGMGGCCGSNFVTRHVDGGGNETRHSYDAAGNRTRTVHRIPTIVDDWEYNAAGQVTAHVLPPNGSGHRRRDEVTYYASGHQAGHIFRQVTDVSGFALQTTNEYDLLGRAIRVIDPRGHDTLYSYNQLNQIVRESSREVSTGSGIRYHNDRYFDANNNIVREDLSNLDESGTVQPNSHYSTIYEYDILNYRTRICQEKGNAALASNVLTCAGVPAGEFVTTEFEYDANRNLTLSRDGQSVNGEQPANVVLASFDERDMPYRVTRGAGDAAQSTLQHDYDANRNLIRTRNGLESVPRVTTNAVDGYNRRVRVTDPMGNVTLHRFDPNGNRTSQRSEGQLVDVPGSAGNVRLWEATYVYDAMDRQIRADVAHFDAATQAGIGDGISRTTTEYAGDGQIVRIIDDNGHASQTTYDTLNRPAVYSDAAGNTTTYAYDANGNITAITQRDISQLGGADQLFTTTLTYDNVDRLITSSDNIGSTTTHGYDSRGNRLLTIDAQGQVMRNQFDGLSRLTRSVRDMNGNGAQGDAADIVIAQAWDDSSRLRSMTDDNGNTTTYDYDALNRLTATTYADGRARTDTHDVYDNVVLATDANGTTWTSTYDLVNREVSRGIVPGAGVSAETTAESYQFDGLSRLVRAEDNDSVVALEYDSPGHLLRETQRQLPGGVPANIASTYDGVGNKTSITYPGGRVVTTVYDALNRRRTISDSSGMLADYRFVGASRVQRRDLGNGTRTEFLHDGMTGTPNPTGDFGVRRIVATRHSRIADGTVLDERTYRWDRLGNKLRRADVRAAGPQLIHDYQYDPANRLNRAQVMGSGGGTIRDTTYAFDGAGNRTTVTGMPDAGSYEMDPTQPDPADYQRNQYTRTPFDGREYDDCGNLIQLGCVRGDANADGTVSVADVAPFAAALVAQSGPSCTDMNADGALDGGDVQGFVDVLFGAIPQQRSIMAQYNYRNLLVRHVNDLTGRITVFAYDALGRRMVRTTEGGGAPTHVVYVHDGHQEIEERGDTGQTLATYVYGQYVDEIVQAVRGGGAVFYHADDMHNVVALSDAGGSVIERYEYGDYGLAAIQAADGAPRDQSVVGNSFMFQGRRFDAALGCYDFRTRYLDPRAGRFVTPDSIGPWADRGALGNAYTFVANNPFSLLDPQGTHPVMNRGMPQMQMYWAQYYAQLNYQFAYMQWVQYMRYIAHMQYIAYMNYMAYVNALAQWQQWQAWLQWRNRPMPPPQNNNAGGGGGQVIPPPQVAPPPPAPPAPPVGQEVCPIPAPPPPPQPVPEPAPPPPPAPAPAPEPPPPASLPPIQPIPDLTGNELYQFIAPHQKPILDKLTGHIKKTILLEYFKAGGNLAELLRQLGKPVSTWKCLTGPLGVLQQLMSAEGVDAYEGLVNIINTLIEENRVIDQIGRDYGMGELEGGIRGRYNPFARWR